MQVPAQVGGVEIPIWVSWVAVGPGRWHVRLGVCFTQERAVAPFQTLDRMALSPLVIAAALVTADFCAKPVEGGVDEPQFCPFATAQEVSTPYFSIVVEAGFLVGLHREGRYLQVQSTLFKNQDALTIEVQDGPSMPAWSDCPMRRGIRRSGRQVEGLSRCLRWPIHETACCRPERPARADRVQLLLAGHESGSRT